MACGGRTYASTVAKRLAHGKRIEIRGFGSFGLNYRPPRTGRNPKSGDKVQVPAKDVPRLRTLSNVHIFEAQTPGFLGFGFDRANPMFADQRVRSAIGLILDADERRDVCWFGTGGNLYGGYIFDSSISGNEAYAYGGGLSSFYSGLYNTILANLT